MSVARWALSLLVPFSAALGQGPDSAAVDPEQIEARFHYQTGKVVIGNGMATLNLPKTFRYLNPKETDIVLSVWGNPPGNTTLGMLVPAGTSVFGESWAVIIQYDEDGHVDDADAAKIDYAKLLRDMQRQTRDDSKERVEAGYGPVELVGWAETPSYDGLTHKLYWAKDLRFGTAEGPHTLNYNIRVLGRRGVLILNAVATMEQLQPVKAGMADIITFVDFNDGHRYGDFVAGRDKVAEYGIAALIAGGIAAKAGFFKVLIAGILALKKVLIVAVVALGAWLKRLFGRKHAEAPQQPQA